MFRVAFCNNRDNIWKHLVYVLAENGLQFQQLLFDSICSIRSELLDLNRQNEFDFFKFLEKTPQYESINILDKGLTCVIEACNIHENHVV